MRIVTYVLISKHPMTAVSPEMLWCIPIKGQWINTWSRARQLFGAHSYCCTLR